MDGSIPPCSNHFDTREILSMLLSVCICTYKRPEWLAKLLRDLGTQQTYGRFTFEVVVADNDAEGGAQTVVASLQPQLPIEVRYSIEPRRSISHVRNETIRNARGEAIVFIDDDEFPDTDWLFQLFD